MMEILSSSNFDITFTKKKKGGVESIWVQFITNCPTVDCRGKIISKETPISVFGKAGMHIRLPAEILARDLWNEKKNNSVAHYELRCSHCGGIILGPED